MTDKHTDRNNADREVRTTHTALATSTTPAPDSVLPERRSRCQQRLGAGRARRHRQGSCARSGSRQRPSPFPRTLPWIGGWHRVWKQHRD